jgi:ubiquinone biosynthesis protein COQ9
MSQMSEADPAAAPSEAFRRRLLAEMLTQAAADGWTDAAMRAAAKVAGLSEGEMHLAAPEGVADLLDAFADQTDQDMLARLAGMDIARMKVRARVTAAIRARIRALDPHRKAAQRAVAALALMRPALAARLQWRTADRIWRALADASADFNYYTKRAILIGVHAAVLAHWLRDETPGYESTWAFLADRIENVMQIEKLKAQAAQAQFWPHMAAAFLGRFRYRGDGPRAEE